jgi:membrane-associated phospholipid phosphatase
MVEKNEVVPEEGGSAPASRWHIVWFLVAAGVLAASAWLASKQVLTGWEYTWLTVVNDWPDRLRMMFLVISMAPNALWIGIAGIVLAFLVRLYSVAWRLAVSILLGAGALLALRELIDRPRPEHLISDLQVRAAEVSPGFPSGHAMVVTLIVLTLFPYVSWVWRVVGVLLVALVSLSRLYLGVHAPLDIIAGCAVGALVVFGLNLLPRRWRAFLRFD